MRYQAWAGIGHDKYLDVMAAILDGRGRDDWEKKVQEMRFETIWPIVDKETAGEIKGYPRPDQMMALTFNTKDQEKICAALNSIEDSKKAFENRQADFEKERQERRGNDT